jgi:YjbE family integral membrane protein
VEVSPFVLGEPQDKKREKRKLDSLIALLPGLLSIVVIDLVLSGDNAVVIGMAARRLPPHQRRMAIIFGGAGAIGLRILFAAIAALLLQIPFLQAAGGFLLVWIAWKLLREDEAAHEVAESVTLIGAMKTIILADVIMSLDNILAIAGVSHGNIGLLIFGLVLSMPIILFGSGLIATVMNRAPWLMLVGAGILTWAAGKMIVHDAIVAEYLPNPAAADILVPLLLTAGVLAPSIWKSVVRRRKAVQVAPRVKVPGPVGPIMVPVDPEERADAGRERVRP